jgi:hypothetical protein
MGTAIVARRKLVISLYNYVKQESQTYEFGFLVIRVVARSWLTIIVGPMAFVILSSSLLLAPYRNLFF